MPTIEERFWSKVDKQASEDCWEWTGAHNELGYGTMRVSRRVMKAHRISWMLSNGEIPDKLHVCHSCDNRGCVRPDHLFLGTHTDNMQDRGSKGRTIRPDNRGERHANSRLTGEQVDEIRSLHDSGVSQSDLSDRYGVSHQTISKVVNRKLWAHRM